MWEFVCDSFCAHTHIWQHQFIDENKTDEEKRAWIQNKRCLYTHKMPAHGWQNVRLKALFIYTCVSFIQSLSSLLTHAHTYSFADEKTRLYPTFCVYSWRSITPRHRDGEQTTKYICILITVMIIMRMALWIHKEACVTHRKFLKTNGKSIHTRTHIAHRDKREWQRIKVKLRRETRRHQMHRWKWIEQNKREFKQSKCWAR